MDIFYYETLTKCKISNVSPNEPFSETDIVEIILKTSDGYVFKDSDKPYIWTGDNDILVYAQSIDINNTRAIITIDFNEYVNRVVDDTIYITAIGYEPSINHPVILNLNNCHGVNLPDEIENGVSYNFTIESNDGYLFDESNDNNPFWSYDGDTGYSEDYFTVSPDRKIATYNGFITDDWGIPVNSFNITGSANIYESPDYGNKYGSINIYQITSEQVEQFTKQRFKYEPVTQGDARLIDDLGDFVSKLHRIYFTVDVENPTGLNVGKYTLNDIQVQTPVNDIHVLECGSIFIPYKNNDANDFKTTIKIFLPFIGFRDMDTDTVIGKNLKVEYHCNIVTGDGVVFIIADDVIIETIECKPITGIYYKAGSKQPQISDDVFNSFLLYGFNTFIVMKWYESINKNSINRDNETVVIDNIDGYARLDNIVGLNHSYMTDNDRDEIVRLLNIGVWL